MSFKIKLSVYILLSEPTNDSGPNADVGIEENGHDLLDVIPVEDNEGEIEEHVEDPVINNRDIEEPVQNGDVPVDKTDISHEPANQAVADASQGASSESKVTCGPKTPEGSPKYYYNHVDPDDFFKEPQMQEGPSSSKSSTGKRKAADDSKKSCNW